MLVLRGHQGPVRCLAYAPDGVLATGGEDGAVGRWEQPAGSLADLLPAEGGAEALAFSPDGRHLAVGTAGGELTLRDGVEVRHGQPPAPPPTPPPPPRRRARLFRRAPVAPAAPAAPAAELALHSGGVRCLAFAPDGSSVATAGWDRKLKLWDVRSLRPRDLPAAGGEAPSALAFVPDSGLLAVGGEGGSLLRHGLAGPGPLPAVATGDGITALACSAQGLLAAGHAGGAVTLWDAASGGPRGELRGHGWAVYGVAFAPDGRTLVTGGADGTVRVWDAALRHERAVFRWHASWVTAVAVAPDGMTAASAGDDGTVVVWDLDVG